MLAQDTTIAFLAASVIVIVAPGPDNLMVLGQGISRGRKAGVSFGLGCALGCLIHTLWATLGVSAIIASSEWSFRGLKIAGALYLFYLGYQAFHHPRANSSTAPTRDHGDKRKFITFLARGFLCNVFNPKVALFFLAFLPQFTDPTLGGVTIQMAILGILFSFMTATIFTALGLFSGIFGVWLGRRNSVKRWFNWAVGSLFIGLSIRLVLFEQPS
jgi:threonine/homoserine/homoserine lactone efflux protein